MNELMEIQNQYKGGRLAKKTYINLMHKRHLMLWQYPDFIRHKNIAGIEITPGGIRLKTKSGVGLVCDALDKRHIFMEILNFGDYEPAELQMIKRFLKKDSVVLDIGANIGWYSVNLSPCLPQGKIIAFEPIPRTYNYLVENIALNKLRNVKTYNIGLSSRRGHFSFYYNRNYTGATSLSNITQADGVQLIKCRVETLDDFLKKIKAGRIDFIKCDTEGAEKFVVEGGWATIKKNQPVIFIELLRKWSAKFNYHPDSVVKMLQGAGYVCLVISKTKLKRIRAITATTQETNFCFLHKTRHAGLLNRLT
jgi:FkbM family methyltransferase